MRILLTNGPLQFSHRKHFLHPDHGELALSQLAAMVDEKNEIQIVDNPIAGTMFRTNNIIPAIRDFKPHLLGISHSCETDTPKIKAIAREIKHLFPDILLVGGGQIATGKFRYLLNNGFDFVVLGEGELTFHELINSIKNGESDFSKIRGLAFKQNGKIMRTPGRAFIEDLDTIPFPARKYHHRIKSSLFPGRFTEAIETSRGCPCACHFCLSSSFWRGTYRKKSNKRIIEELKNIQSEIGPAHIYFVDESFCMNVPEYCELFQNIVDEGIDIKWWTHIRADTINDNPEMIRLAKRAGMYGALVGFEGYNTNILKSVGKPGSLKTNRKASEILRENDIEDFRQTFKYGRKISDIFWMSFFYPLPGTRTFEEYRNSGRITLTPDHHREQSYTFTFDQNILRMQRLYFFYWIRYYLSLRTLLDLLLSKNRFLFKMRFFSYKSVALALFYKFLRDTGLRR